MAYRKLGFRDQFALVLDVVRGHKSLEQVSREAGVSTADLQRWIAWFYEGALERFRQESWPSQGTGNRIVDRRARTPARDGKWTASRTGYGERRRSNRLNKAFPVSLQPLFGALWTDLESAGAVNGPLWEGTTVDLGVQSLKIQLSPEAESRFPLLKEGENLLKVVSQNGSLYENRARIVRIQRLEGKPTEIILLMEP